MHLTWQTISPRNHSEPWCNIVSQLSSNCGTGQEQNMSRHHFLLPAVTMIGLLKKNPSKAGWKKYPPLSFRAWRCTTFWFQLPIRTPWVSWFYFYFSFRDEMNWIDPKASDLALFHPTHSSRNTFCRVNLVRNRFPNYEWPGWMSGRKEVTALKPAQAKNPVTSLCSYWEAKPCRGTRSRAVRLGLQ